jgi:DNA gyrase/topoisomerase IV subunit A
MARPPKKPVRPTKPTVKRTGPIRDTDNVVRGVIRKTKRAAANDLKRIEAFATVKLGDTAEENMLAYGKHTVEERAISCLNDGLKPVHRRNVYGLYRMGLHYNSGHTKAAKVVGEVMGNFHPHGDSSIYDAMVGMSNGAGCCSPFVDGQGNWGDYEDSAAAMRYTECRLTRLADTVLVPKPYMDDSVIPYIPNYDGKDKEPIYLPSHLPFLFANGSQGTAVGVSCNMPPYRLESLIECVETLFRTRGNGKKAAAKLQLMHRWGALPQVAKEDLDAYHATGAGKVFWKAPYTIKELRNGGSIISVTALPLGTAGGYETWKANLEAIDGVYRVDNLSSEGVIMIEIETRSEAAHDKAIKKLTISETYRAMTTLREPNPDDPETAKVTFLATSPVDMLERWYHYRVALEQRLIDALVRDNIAESRRLNLMVLAATNLDKLVVIIKAKSGDKVAMIERALKVNHEDAQTIWRLTVSQLDALNTANLKSKLAALAAETKLLKSQRADPTARISDALKKVSANGALLPQYKNAENGTSAAKPQRRSKVNATEDEAD